MAEPQLILVFYSCVPYIPVAYNSAAYFTALLYEYSRLLPAVS